MDYDPKRDARVDSKRRQNRKEAKIIKRSIRSWDDDNKDFEYQEHKKRNQHRYEDEE